MEGGILPQTTFGYVWTHPGLSELVCGCGLASSEQRTWGTAQRESYRPKRRDAVAKNAGSRRQFYWERSEMDP